MKNNFKQSYIVVDLDDTLLDPSYRRINSILCTGRNDLAVWGSKVSKNPEKYMTKKQKQIFSRNFNGRWADMDCVKWDIVEKVKSVQQKTGLPIIILTGRYEKLMKETTFEKIRVLQRHLKIQKVVMRKTNHMPAAQWKIQQVKKIKIHPAYVFDDDIIVRKLFKNEFKNISIMNF